MKIEEEIEVDHLAITKTTTTTTIVVDLIKTILIINIHQKTDKFTLHIVVFIKKNQLIPRFI